jgi:hypothetical protein
MDYVHIMEGTLVQRANPKLFLEDLVGFALLQPDQSW